MTINNEKIADIMQKSPTAESFASYAARRARGGREARNGVSTIPAIRKQMEKEGFHVVPEDMLLMFKALDQAGIGQLKGKNFKWNLSLRRVGELAEQAGVATQEPITKPLPKEPTKKPVSKKSLIAYFGPGRDFEAEFPSDLTQDELAFILDKILHACSK